MPDQVTKIDFYMGTIANKPGEGFRILSALQQAGINLTAFLAYPKTARKAEVVFVADAASPAFGGPAKKAGLEVGKKQKGFFVSGGDRPGAVAELLSKLAEAGMNVVSCHALCGGQKTYGALLVVDQADFRKAAKLLGA